VTSDDQDGDFAEYVSVRGPWLRKIGFLLSGDWHQADDLAQATVTKLYARWDRLGDVQNMDGYARTTLVNTYLAERRSPWHRVLFRLDTERVAPQQDLDAALDVREALDDLPPRQRATVVLRYYCDLTVEQTAEALNCSPGTVKSQTARGLDALRRSLEAGRTAARTGGGQ
jgi:RNA polymerase sigma-70 factor (sigma-E family)